MKTGAEKCEQQSVKETATAWLRGVFGGEGTARRREKVDFAVL